VCFLSYFDILAGQNHREEVQAMVQACCDDGRVAFPLGEAVVETASWTHELLHSRDGRAELTRFGVNERGVHELYSKILLKFNAFWIDENPPSIMQYRGLSEAFRLKMKQHIRSIEVGRKPGSTPSHAWNTVRVAIRGQNGTSAAEMHAQIRAEKGVPKKDHPAFDSPGGVTKKENPSFKSPSAQKNSPPRRRMSIFSSKKAQGHNEHESVAKDATRKAPLVGIPDEGGDTQVDEPRGCSSGGSQSSGSDEELEEPVSLKFKTKGSLGILFASQNGEIVVEGTKPKTLAAKTKELETGLVLTAVSGLDAKLAQKLGQLQLFIPVFPHECMDQLAYCGPT
jgi:hypothetical protein